MNEYVYYIIMLNYLYRDVSLFHSDSSVFVYGTFELWIMYVFLSVWLPHCGSCLLMLTIKNEVAVKLELLYNV